MSRLNNDERCEMINFQHHLRKILGEPTKCRFAIEQYRLAARGGDFLSFIDYRNDFDCEDDQGLQPKDIVRIWIARISGYMHRH